MRVSIAEKFGQVVESMQIDGKPYYMYGHRQEISTRLTNMEKDKVKKYEKYPLIALRMDLVEDVYDGIAHCSLNVLILTKTRIDDWVPDRYARSFNPILYPLYERLITALSLSGVFFWPGDQETPPHKSIDRPYWGNSGPEANTANFMNDPIDAIELVDLKINTFIKQNC